MLRRFVTMATDFPAKRMKPSPPLIGTHSGHFHADEALAVYLLRLLPNYRQSPLVRTRDPAVLETCHTVVDVGGEYSTDNHRFDHHQRGFTTMWPGRSATPLSSAGLVWLHFGRDVIATRTGLESQSDATGILWEKLYADFVEAVDANDNGVHAHQDAARFKTSGVTLASLVSDLNHEIVLDDAPGLPEHESGAPPAGSETGAEGPQAAEDARFLRASSLMGTTFLRKLHGLHSVWLPARDVVQQAYAARTSLDPSGRLLVMPKAGIPWKEHLYSIEEGEDGGKKDNGQVVYVLYPESEEPGAKWRVQCVPVSAESFESRRPLPEQWRGLRDEALSKEAGIEGCVFVHMSGFIGGNTTREGAISMAQKALNTYPETG